MEEVKRSVEAILDDPRYKKKAQLLQWESVDLDCFHLVEKELKALIE